VAAACGPYFGPVLTPERMTAKLAERLDSPNPTR
jgi:hypothetical protein